MSVFGGTPTNLDTILRSLFPMKNNNILFWNSRGAGGAAFLSTIRELIRSHDPSVVALVETHVSSGRADLVCRSIGFDGVLRVDADGFAGGIWLLWRTDLVTVTPISLDPQHITVEINRQGEIPWVLSAVYASPNYYRRDQLWSTLGDFARANNRPWLIGGDFNATLDSTERTYNSDYANRASAAFASWVNGSQLIDLGFSGPRFTWKYGTTMRTYHASRLDRFLSNVSWRVLFPEAVVNHLTVAHSDHAPLSLSSHPPEASLGDRPFRFLAAWTLSEDFKGVVTEAWNSGPVSLTGSISKLTDTLQVWNRKSFGNIFHRKKKLLARIEGARWKLCNAPSQGLISREQQLCREYDEVLTQEQLLWFQKSRAKFLIEGDRNTRYYHLSTIVRRRASKVLGLFNSDGMWISNRTEVERMVVDFFARLYTADPSTSNLAAVPTLGVPIASDRLSKNRYQFLLDKVASRLKGWKAKTLSMPGRVVLANSVLQSIPLYVMQSTMVPRSVCDAIDQSVRSFVWGSTQETRKPHLLAWDKIAKPRKFGGLGLRSMRQSNAAVLAKLGWRAMKEPESIWSRVIRGKYCDGRVDVDMFRPRPKESYT
ncbi:hypothetical protein V2J09_009694 [Rumex salicifolius]